MPTHLKIDTRGSDELFRKMGWTIKNSVPGFLRQEARLVAVECARRAQPFGDGATARAVGEAATTSDIYRIYATAGKVYAAFANKGAATKFLKAMLAGNYQKANWIMVTHCPRFSNKQIKPFDGGAAHRQFRNNRGRIPKSQEPAFVVQPDSSSSWSTATTALKAYIQQEVSRVGFGKGGWATCAKALGGTRGIPGWVSRQNSPGQVIENYKAELSSVTMTNQVPYASEILTEFEKQNAIDIAKDRLGKSVKRAFQEITHRG